MKDIKKKLRWYEQKWFLIFYFTVWIMTVILFLALPNFFNLFLLILISFFTYRVYKYRKDGLKRILSTDESENKNRINQYEQELSPNILESNTRYQAASTIADLKTSKNSNQITFNVAGVTFENDEGKDIQQLLKKIAREIAKENELFEPYGGWTNRDIIEYYVEVSEFEDLEFGDLVSFQKDPNNEFDKNAIKVMININSKNYHIGYVPKKNNIKLSELINSKAIKNIEANFVGGKIKKVDFDEENDKDIVITDEITLGVQITVNY